MSGTKVKAKDKDDKVDPKAAEPKTAEKSGEVKAGDAKTADGKPQAAVVIDPVAAAKQTASEFVTQQQFAEVSSGVARLEAMLAKLTMQPPSAAAVAGQVAPAPAASSAPSAPASAAKSSKKKKKKKAAEAPVPEQGIAALRTMTAGVVATATAESKDSEYKTSEETFVQAVVNEAGFEPEFDDDDGDTRSVTSRQAADATTKPHRPVLSPHPMTQATPSTAPIPLHIAQLLDYQGPTETRYQEWMAPGLCAEILTRHKSAMAWVQSEIRVPSGTPEADSIYNEASCLATMLDAEFANDPAFRIEANCRRLIALKKWSHERSQPGAKSGHGVKWLKALELLRAGSATDYVSASMSRQMRKDVDKMERDDLAARSAAAASSATSKSSKKPTPTAKGGRQQA